MASGVNIAGGVDHGAVRGHQRQSAWRMNQRQQSISIESIEISGVAWRGSSIKSGEAAA